MLLAECTTAAKIVLVLFEWCDKSGMTHVCICRQYLIPAWLYSLLPVGNVPDNDCVKKLLELLLLSIWRILTFDGNCDLGANFNFKHVRLSEENCWRDQMVARQEENRFLKACVNWPVYRCAAFS